MYFHKIKKNEEKIACPFSVHRSICTFSATADAKHPTLEKCPSSI